MLARYFHLYRQNVVDILPMCGTILIQELASLSSGVLRVRGLFST